MTGFGRAEEIIEGRDIIVEIRSVNHRYYEFSARVPRAYGYIEEKLKSHLNGRISRGKVEVSVSITAIEAADIVLMDDDPLKIAKAIRISRKCLGIVYENIVFAIGIKLICLALGALGLANMWLAIFADVGVMVIAVLNAIRALAVKNV